MPNSALGRLKVDDWDRMIDVNLKGVLYGIAAALPHMQRQKSGHFITTIRDQRVINEIAAPGRRRAAMRISDFITANLEAILNEWEALAKERRAAEGNCHV
jgi:hypothetical protein